MQLCRSRLKEALDREKLLQTFMPGGRLKQMPAQWKKKLVIFREIAKGLPSGVYTEPEMNELLRIHGEDYCTLRRDLVELGYISREKGIYTVPIRDREDNA